MTDMQIILVPCTPFQQNASLVICTKTKKCAIVDPGGDLHLFKSAVKEMGVTPVMVLLTHGHIDHAGAATDCASEYNVQIIGPHIGDESLMQNLPKQAAMFGMEGVKACTSDRWLVEGDQVTVGELTFDCLHVPGHSPGSIVFVNKKQHFALVGDTLFQGSVGRTDFPYGDTDLLITGIKTKLLTLDDDYTILPGHGAASTIGNEKARNPFLQS